MPSWVRWIVIALLGFFAIHSQSQNPPGSLTLRVNVSHRLGRIRPMQDVVNGPLCERGFVDLTKYYKALGIHNIRLHDVPWTYDNALDINYVFPNWNADPDRPESYDFTESDYYLKTITDLGANIIFRLGYSAEYKTPLHHNAPPASYDKWADIAAHIVRHYNGGWANGQKLGIKYWEIWNEPDHPMFWSGTPEQFDRLYEVTARTLKHMDPSLKVGGPALGVETLVGRPEFLDQFLNYCQRHQVPVDFVSWHIYPKDPNEVSTRAQMIYGMMKQYGFGRSKNILDEWNYGGSFDLGHGGTGAALDAAVLMKLQDSPVDIATFYTGTTLMWGMFTPWGTPLKPYYAFLAFRRLLDSPNRVAVDPVADDQVTTLAGISEDERTARILVSNRSKTPRTVRIQLDGLPWKGPSQYQKQVVSDRYDLQTVGGSKTVSTPLFTEEVGGTSVALLTIKSSTSQGNNPEERPHRLADK